MTVHKVVTLRRLHLQLQKNAQIDSYQPGISFAAERGPVAAELEPALVVSLEAMCLDQVWHKQLKKKVQNSRVCDHRELQTETFLVQNAS